MIPAYTPTYTGPKAYHLSPKKLAELGIRCVLTDLDSTLMPSHYNAQHPEHQATFAKALAWVQALHQQGIELCVISNNHHQRYVEQTASLLGIPPERCVAKAAKPNPAPSHALLQHYHAQGLTPTQFIMLGDRPMTDIGFANALGIRSVLVDPILAPEKGVVEREEPWPTRLVRGLERLLASPTPSFNA